MSYSCRQVADEFESIAPISSGIPGDELGFVFGDPTTLVRGLACLWQVNAKSIELAAEAGANFLLCHESIWLPEQSNSAWYQSPGEIYSNSLRRDLLEKHKMVVYRSHSNWDNLPVNGVPDQVVAALKIPDVQVVAQQRFFKVHRLPRSYSVAELAQCARSGLQFDGVRVFGDSKKKIEQFAFLIGGFGENQWHMPQAARKLGAEAIVIGEMSEFIVSAALEMGMPVIETLHSVSESPAIVRQAQMMAERLPGLPVYFVPSGAHAWTTGAGTMRISS